MSYTPSYLSTTPNIVSPPLYSYGLGTSNSNNGNSMDWLGVANLGLNALSGIFGMSAQDKQNKLQQQLAQQQMQWQSEENEKAFQRNVQMFNMENAYNDPSAVMARLKNAGVNPFVAFGSGGAASGMTAAGSGNVTNGGMSPVMPNLQAVPTGFGAVVSGTAQGLSQYANLLKTLGEAKKLGVDTKYIELKLPKELESMDQGIILQKWQNSMNKLYGEKKINKELDKIVSEINKNVEQALMYWKEGNESEARRLLHLAERDFTSANAQYRLKEVGAFDNTRDLLNQLTQAQIKTEGTKQSANIASANASNAIASNQYAQRDYTVAQKELLEKNTPKLLEYQDWLNQGEKDKHYLTSWKLEEISTNFGEICKSYQLQNLLTEAQAGLATAQMKKAIKEGNIVYAKFLMESIVGLAGATVSAGAGAKALGVVP